jgi:hypothetical protein
MCAHGGQPRDDQVIRMQCVHLDGLRWCKDATSGATDYVMCGRGRRMPLRPRSSTCETGYIVLKLQTRQIVITFVEVFGPSARLNRTVDYKKHIASRRGEKQLSCLWVGSTRGQDGVIRTKHAMEFSVWICRGRHEDSRRICRRRIDQGG